MKSVLLIGQSNMAGRGFLHETTPIYNERIFMLRNGRWQMMAEPIHFDRTVAGIGPASSFAEAWCNANRDKTIGLIPCAEGGSSIDEWQVSGTLFRHAVRETRFALENSELIAILWHQGESDSYGEKYKEYYGKLDRIVNGFRTELGIENVPFIIGGLGDYLGKSAFGAGCIEYKEINKELQKYAENHENCYFVTGNSLFSNPDGIHINAESQRRFGLRYFESFNNKSHVYVPLANETDLAEKLLKRSNSESEEKYIALEKFTLGMIPYDELLNVL